MQFGICLMHEKDVLGSIGIGMTTNTAHPAEESGTPSVPGLRVSALEASLAGVRGGDGRDRLAQCIGLGFADAAVESLMGFLLAVCSILGSPLGMFVENFDTSLQHGEEPTLRKVWTQ